MIDLTSVPIVEHHVHSLLREPPRSVQAYQWLFTESDDPDLITRHVPHTVFFRWAVREVATFLGCEPTVEAILTARETMPPDDLARRFFADARIDTLLVDYGFRQEENLTLEEMRLATGCRVEPVLRLETLAESLILEQETFDAVVDAFVATVEAARRTGHVALKSIIAYRTGLDIAEVAREEAAAAFVPLKEQARREGRVRLAVKPLCDYLVLQALTVAQREALPVQFHTGFGDRDVDLRLGNPLHLRGLLQSGRFHRVPIVILHAGYPYVRETAYLANVYGNVYADISLAIPFAAGDIPGLITEMLGMAPLSKVLYSSDAFSIPELFWLAARLGRWGLARALEALVSAGLLLPAEAEEAGAQILHGNARALYGLA